MSEQLEFNFGRVIEYATFTEFALKTGDPVWISNNQGTHLYRYISNGRYELIVEEDDYDVPY